ncbi:sensor histidine kinase [Litorimonas sp.]|jgi:two-component sensor histidine kinase|uniref:sensor histidine kinase n=1 Tax=Litorimonas sp. TaxID=1892381 RepID=UPI003A862721
MKDLRIRFGVILGLCLLPILIFSVFLSFKTENPITVVVCLLALAFAYVAIWISTDKLIFLPLRKIHLASLKFSGGDLEARVADLNRSPDKITSIGTAFNEMAENISIREARLLDNLVEKETLLREIHHRVKNNLQIIISLLNMQERKLTDLAGLDAIQETRSRINAIALVHRGLYEGDDLRLIRMDVFLKRLIAELESGLEVEEAGIDVSLKVDCDTMEPDNVIPVALFIVEALSNSVKHGLPNGGDIQIMLICEDETISVSVVDNGQGTDVNSLTGVGYKLMRGFARQLGGEFIIQTRKKGHGVTLKFPLN